MELQKKYQRQRMLYGQKRIYFCELRELYREMGDIYREYQNTYWLYWRAIVNNKEKPSEAELARQKLHEFEQKLRPIREAITQKQQQIEEYQRTQEGWVVFPVLLKDKIG